MEKVCAYVLSGDGSKDIVNKSPIGADDPKERSNRAIDFNDGSEDFGPLTFVRNKSALPIFGMYRIIDFVLSNLMNSDIENVGIITQYLPGSLMEHIGIGIPWDFVGFGRKCRVLPPFYDRTSMQWYKNPYDGIKKNLFFAKNAQADDVLILSGENVYTFDYRPLIDYHRMNDADITVVVKKMKVEETAGKLGLVRFDKKGRITSYIENPQNIKSDGFASIGIFLFRYSVFSTVFGQCKLSGTKDEALTELMKSVKKFKTNVYITEEEWYYIRDVKEYFSINSDFLKEERVKELDKWNIRTSLEDRNTGFRPSSIIGAQSHTKNIFLPKGCVIDGFLENVILSPGVIIENGAEVNNSIIFHDVIVHSGAKINNTIIDKDVKIGEGAIIGGDKSITIIGKGTKIKKNSIIPAGTLIQPQETV